MSRPPAVLDDARPSGAIAVRLTGDEAAALIQTAALASIRLTEQARLGHRLDDLAAEARALASAVRKLDSLGDVDALEIHARPPILERNGP